MTQYIRLILDAAFVGIAILLFYMWSSLNEKYRRVKEECERRGKYMTILSSRVPTEKDCSAKWNLWVVNWIKDPRPCAFIQLSDDSKKPEWVEYKVKEKDSNERV